MTNTTRIHRLDHRASELAITSGYANIEGLDVDRIYAHLVDTVNDQLPDGWEWMPATSELHAPDGQDIDYDRVYTLIEMASEEIDISDDRWYA